MSSARAIGKLTLESTKMVPSINGVEVSAVNGAGDLIVSLTQEVEDLVDELFHLGVASWRNLNFHGSSAAIAPWMNHPLTSRRRKMPVTKASILNTSPIEPSTAKILPSQSIGPICNNTPNGNRVALAARHVASSTRAR